MATEKTDVVIVGMGAAGAVLAAEISKAGMKVTGPGPHTRGGTRPGGDPKTSVVNRYSQSRDVPNLLIVGTSTHPSMSGFNPTLTLEALAYRYRKSPGPLA
jgi:gluconate 2-dehydrogenase alpha chain